MNHDDPTRELEYDRFLSFIHAKSWVTKFPSRTKAWDKGRWFGRVVGSGQT